MAIGNTSLMLLSINKQTNENPYGRSLSLRRDTYKDYLQQYLVLTVFYLRFDLCLWVRDYVGQKCISPTH